MGKGDGFVVFDIKGKSLKMHYNWNGKIEVISRVKINSKEDLALVYTPGVAEACLEVHKDPNKVYSLTRKNNLVAVITDGTAVLGLGDIGPEAAMPVMEGKCVLFKEFAGVDAFPMCINSKDIDEIVNTVKLISKSFGGINLEDIAAPRCFEIEKRLKEVCDIPIFHDDQHGTAVVVAAALINALKLTKKEISEIKIVINGAGAAGIAIAKHLLNFGAQNIILVDKRGIIYEGRDDLTGEKEVIARLTNKNHLKGGLKEAVVEADVFIGVSVANVLTKDMVKSMKKDPIVFAMANPVPEIMPDEAKEAGARIIGTGRSDFPNQINNVLAFPGIFRGTLDCRASTINEEMKKAASIAIANLISKEELREEYIIPDPLDKRVVPSVAEAVIKAAKETGVARI